MYRRWRDSQGQGQGVREYYQVREHRPHLRTNQRGRERHVPPLARLQGQGQGVREYYQVRESTDHTYAPINVDASVMYRRWRDSKGKDKEYENIISTDHTYAPINVDASVMYRRWRDSKGKDKEYENIIRKQAQVARVDAEKEGIVVFAMYWCTLNIVSMQVKESRMSRGGIVQSHRVV
ncbi:Ubiquitin-conjugating enzyme E2 R1 [Operophtera brumata]|uniref:Ubiquitin-conjugating enzyme E2 R1 n=1 Tax=Operophtera brumata TaxID=104452 RepID=A0A0L7L1D8_OPEBR|nr:Ubiquitin-conjugating enzyme E2 R1 [Operophtera brumata]